MHARKEQAHIFVSVLGLVAAMMDRAQAAKQGLHVTDVRCGKSIAHLARACSAAGVISGWNPFA